MCLATIIVHSATQMADDSSLQQGGFHHQNVDNVEYIRLPVRQNWLFHSLEYQYDNALIDIFVHI